MYIERIVRGEIVGFVGRVKGSVVVEGFRD